MIHDIAITERYAHRFDAVRSTSMLRWAARHSPIGGLLITTPSRPRPETTVSIDDIRFSIGPYYIFTR